MAATGVAAFVLVTLPAPAFAKDTQPTAQATTATRALRDATDAWTIATKMYKAASAARDAAMQSINDTFVAAVKKARADLDLALRRATTASAKYAANARYFDAVSAATQARAAARDALPPLPAQPGAKPTAEKLQARAKTSKS